MMIDSQISRVLDANANRAREGLRTAEDFVRFILVDLNHSERLRTLRQSLTDTMLSIKGLGQALIEARNVSSDPLQPDNWKDVLRREGSETPKDVAHRGLKRAQEALRVLEEFLRGSQPAQAERLSTLRYGAYEAEQWLICASSAMQVLLSSNVYVLMTAEHCRNKDVIKTTQLLLNSGIKLIQLREKQQCDVELLSLLTKMRLMCEDSGAVLFCNDRLDMALLSKTGGVHVGQTDMTPSDVRRLAGQRLLIGRSTHSVEQARAAVDVEKADYIGIGSMFETQTKSNPVLKGLKLAEEIAGQKLDVPVFAIGGITLDRLPALKSAGVTRVAVSQAIIGSAAPDVEARKFIEAMAI